MAAYCSLEQGYLAVICKGADAAIETIKSYLAADNSQS